MDLSGLPPWLSETIIFTAIVAGAYLLSEILVLVINLTKRYLASRTATDLDDQILDAIKAPVRYIMIFVGATIALKRLNLMVDEKSDWIFKITNGIVFVLFALVVMMVMFRVTRIFSNWYSTDIAAKTESSVGGQLMPLVRRIANLIIFIIGAVTILDHFEVDVKGLIAVLGVGSLAIALAAQDTIANMIAGFIIMIDRPFRKGDKVVLVGGEMVDVYDIGLRSSKFMTVDNTMIIVPNNELVKAKITNLSYLGEDVRVAIEVSVAHGSDIEAVKGLLVKIATEQKNVLEEPQPEAFLTAIGDNALNFTLVCRVAKLGQQWKTAEELRVKIYNEFEKNGVNRPFPQQIIKIARGK